MRPTVPGTSRVLTAVGAILAGLLLPAQPAAPATAPAWSVDLAADTPDQSNIAHTGHGLTVRDPHAHPAAAPAGQSYAEYTAPRTALGRSVTALTVDTDATRPAGSRVDTEVRGQDGSGAWTQWRTATGRRVGFPAPVSFVQVRVVLTAAGDSPTVSGVRLSAAEPVATPQAGGPARAADVTFHVYATREGLAGGTTANGHVITDHDHFAALPSGRMLASNGGTEYQVRICHQGRCETAPVWDIGPWNTHDDYWNPGDQREAWNDLPQGTPEAQAAFQSGYHGGLDESGRQVGNPAGIDLADGTFWDGLGMTDNDWVDVTFQPTGGGTTTVTAWSNANVRSCQHLSCGVVSYVTAGNTYSGVCWAYGDTVTDLGITNDKWVKLALNAGGYGWVSAIYLKGDDTGGVPNPC